MKTKTRIVLAALLTFNLALGTFFVYRGLVKQQEPARKIQPAVVSKKSEASYRKAVVQGAIRARTNQLEDCYNSYLQSQPTVVEGSIKIGWDVSPDGEVSAVRVIDNELASAEFADCVAARIRAWDFTPAGNGEVMVIAHKFNFHQRSPANLDFE